MWKQITSAQALVPVHGQSTRTVSPVVITDQLAVPAWTDAQRETWSNYAVENFCLPDEGDVSNLGDSAQLVSDSLQALVDSWLTQRGLVAAKTQERAFALLCVGSPFHHDADSYCDEAFCVVWLDGGDNWDLLFPHIDVRIKLSRGLVVLFDSAQPHGVVARGKTTFSPGDFPWDGPGSFLSQDLSLKHDGLRSAMQISRHPLAGAAGYYVLPTGYSDDLDPETAIWGVDGDWAANPGVSEEPIA